MISAELRAFVYARAQGKCEYCRVPDDDGYMTHEIDHIYAEKHDGQTIESNLCLSCWLCNRHKGTDLTSLDPETGDIVRLYHPRRDQWSDHFALNGARIQALTDVGRVTVKLLQMNRRERVDERRMMIALGRYH